MSVVHTLASLEPTRNAVEVERMLQYELTDPFISSHNLTLQIPHATVHPSLSAPWLAWHSIPAGIVSAPSSDANRNGPETYTGP